MSNKERNDSHFVSLFNIGPFDNKKQGRISKSSRGEGERFFRVAIIYEYTPAAYMYNIGLFHYLNGDRDL